MAQPTEAFKINR